MKVKLLLALVLFVALAVGVSLALTQTIITFEKTFGGKLDDVGYSVIETKDGYVVAGYTWSFGAGGPDVYLVKSDSKGNKIWEKTFGGEENDSGKCVIETKDGGYVIVGTTNLRLATPVDITTFSLMEGADVYLVKTDSKGNKIWEKTFGGEGNDLGQSVIAAKDGGYVIVGWTSSFGAGEDDVYLIKTDSNGNKIWDKTFGGRSNDNGYSVLETKDGGYVIVGNTLSFGAGMSDVYLIKTDSKGNKIWEKTFGGEGWDMGKSVIETVDGSYIIVGRTDSFGSGKSDVYLIKTDSNGNKIWEKTFGGVEDDEGYSVFGTKDGGCIIAGYTKSFWDEKGKDVYLIRIGSNGNKFWERTFGGKKDDEGYSVIGTKDGGYIITGETSSFDAGLPDVYLIKTDPKGNIMK
jgi:hypothetical protein